MKRYNKLQELFYESIERECHGIYKQKALFHSLQVCALCQKLALEQGLDVTLAMIIGLFHDYAQFIHHTSFDHASRSAQMLRPYLNEFSPEDIHIIITAIQNHSHKERIDDAYSEIVKDADILAQYFYEPDIVFDDIHQKRLLRYIKK